MEPKRQKLDLEIVNETNYIFNINDFPNEVIEKIFSFLTQNQLGQIARVCKKWNALTKSPILWKKVTVRFIFSSDKEKDAQSLNTFIDGLPSSVTFMRLYFLGRTEYLMDFEKLCMKLHHTCPDLEVLILSGCDISAILPEVINSCTQFLQGLKKLVLYVCSFKDYSATLDLKDNSKIEYLDLYGSDLFDCNRIQFSKLRSLKELRLAQTNVDDDWFAGDTSPLNHLQVLDLRETRITGSTFIAIQRHGQNLKELYVCNSRLRDDDLHFNGPVFPHLQTICVRGTFVTCEGLVTLVRSCPSLVNVYVREIEARFFAEHPFVVANSCKLGIVKSIIGFVHHHNIDYWHS